MGFLSVCKVIEYSSDQEWNQTLNDTYIYRRGSWKIFTEIDVKGKCPLVLSDTLHIIIWFFLFINKVWEHEKDEWKMEFCSYEYYYVYGILYSRLESKSA